MARACSQLPGRLGGHLAEERLLEVGQVEELVAGDVAERPLRHLAEDDGEERRPRHPPPAQAMRLRRDAPHQVLEDVDVALEDDGQADVGRSRPAKPESVPATTICRGCLRLKKKSEAATPRMSRTLRRMMSKRRSEAAMKADPQLEEEGGAPVERERHPDGQRGHGDPELRQRGEEEQPLGDHHRAERPGPGAPPGGGGAAPGSGRTAAGSSSASCRR